MTTHRGACIDFGATEDVEKLEVFITLLAVCSNELTYIYCTLKTRFMFQELLNCGVDNEVSSCKITNYKPPFHSDKPVVHVFSGQ